MTQLITERPLYGRIALETSAWASTFTWVDRTSTLVGGMSYSEGGRIGTPGAPSVDVGALTATFKNAATIPAVGDLVRLKRTGTSEYFWIGYVQDVSQSIVFDNSVSAATPVTLTSIYCLDWVGYISQFQAVGIGGANVTTGVAETTSNYNWRLRVAALNAIIDPAYTTLLITPQAGTPSTPNLGDTDLVATISEHLDLAARQSDFIWYGNHVLPTNRTTGRTGLVSATFLNNLTSTAKTFSDTKGTPGQYLHYTEIDFENSTQNIANTVVVNNRTRLHVADVEVTKIGGFNETNNMIINNTSVIGVGVDSTWNATDSTSITSYGIRQTEVDINVTLPPSSSGAVNLLANPSVEYTEDGYFGDSTTVTRRRKPSEDANPFNAYNGQWAMRNRMKGATNSVPIIAYTGSEADGTPVVAGTTYYFFGWGARGQPNRADVRARARIKWYDADEAAISTVYGAQTAMFQNVWTLCTTGAQVAPAGAVRAQVGLEFNRSGGGNFSAGDVNWADGFVFTKSLSVTTYFDGDTPGDATYQYLWTGGVGASPSYRILNYVDDVATNLLAQYSTTSMRVSRIRWNAQEDLTAVSTLTVGKTISIIFKGTTTTYRIIGIDGNVSPDRFMVDYYLAKV